MQANNKKKKKRRSFNRQLQRKVVPTWLKEKFAAGLHPSVSFGFLGFLLFWLPLFGLHEAEAGAAGTLKQELHCFLPSCAECSENNYV
uniref:Uncharacterized protein n=1 Tax=Nelumbo nucifera TaxID=4432 RepID=A0A822XT17_NELNU|nr:TPA_asm: hypothetical protein HUJ06_024316 [Nelumbo nucifera]